VLREWEKREVTIAGSKMSEERIVFYSEEIAFEGIICLFEKA